jgi:uncharacterized protein with ParB-like and HNH nuclease domain
MDARAKSIREILLSGDQYLVPFFQRSYSWGRKQWGRLQDDICALLEDSSQKQHFLGPLVCTPGKHVPGEINPYQLIDGQQRMTTLTLLLTALRDVSMDRDQQKLAEEIGEDLLVHKRHSGLQRYKIVPRLGDRERLIALIDRKELPEPKDAELLKAYRYFRKWIEKLSGTNTQILRDILTTVKDRLSLVMITITGENPYEIFESLNSTGLPLQESDLIRNYIFMQVTPLEAQDEFNREHWSPFETILQSKSGGKTVDPTGFYREYVMRIGQYSKKGSTFVDFKDQNRARNLAAADQVKELRQFLTYARWIGGHDTTENPAVDNALSRLVYLQVSTANPLLLNLLDGWHCGTLQTDDLVGCLIDLASFVIRRTACGLSSRGYARWFVDAITKIGATPRADLQQFYLSKGWPSDAQFASALIEFDLYKREASKTRLILESLEDSYGHKERVDKRTLTIEHVLPQSPNAAAVSELRALLGDKGADWFPLQQKWVNTLGNLTLTGYNPELSNRPFSEKRPALLKSNLVLNQYFEEVSNWGPKEIAQRGRALAQQVADIWPNPVQHENQNSGELPIPRHSFDIAALRQASVERIERFCRANFTTEDYARFSAQDGSLKLLCVASQPYSEGQTTGYWFGVSPEQLAYLKTAEKNYVALCCGSPDRVLLLTCDEFELLTAYMNVTEGKHWHVQIAWGDKVLLDQPKATETKLDVTRFVFEEV